jgi:hypothetical protein
VPPQFACQTALGPDRGENGIIGGAHFFGRHRLTDKPSLQF